jgi:hypothetical protein
MPSITLKIPKADLIWAGHPVLTGVPFLDDIATESANSGDGHK